LITTFGGKARNAPALREVPLAPNPEAQAFGGRLIAREVDLLVLLTGVGTRILVSQLEEIYTRDEIVAALRDTRILARGPKPLAVLRDLGVPAWIAAAEPNTWRELIVALDARAAERPLDGARVAVQEYGVSNVELLDALRTRGAIVTTIPAYEWTMPEDLAPLRDSARRVAGGEADVMLFLSGIQLVHFWRVVVSEGLEASVRDGMAQAVVASIGPSCSSEIRRHALAVDLEASPPRMGVLVRAAAEHARRLIRAKRASVSRPEPS
jgi:uroporphyrinogen-III synthase